MKVLLDRFSKAESSTRGGRQRLYERVVGRQQTEAEWAVFKHQLFELKLSGVSIEEGYERLLNDSSLPSIKKLACFFLVLCLSTVWCERGFSLMALIKTKLRNGLGTETLDAFMMISSNGPEISDKVAVRSLVEAAYVIWATKAKRMPSRSHPGVKKPRKNKADS